MFKDANFLYKYKDLRIICLLTSYVVLLTYTSFFILEIYLIFYS